MHSRNWPLFDLVVRTPMLELRYLDDESANELADLSRHPIHDASTMPFTIPWTDVPDDERARQSLQHVWGTRANWSRDSWRCPMAVRVGGEIVGAQDFLAEHFALRRCVTTGSWLTKSRQGQGIGKEMRTAILHLAFAGLGAEMATTSAFHDNERSLGVTRALGYEPNGSSIELRRDRADTQLHFRMTREQWEQRRRDDIQIDGLDACLDLFGILPD